MDKKVDEADTTRVGSSQHGQNVGLGAGPIGKVDIASEPVVTKESNRASQVLNEGRLLAGLLHHKEYLVAHLLLAISRSADGAEELIKWDVKAENVNLLCWKALEREPVWKSGGSTDDNPSARATVSADIMEVHRWAGIIAAGKRQGTLEFGDLVEAIVASRISPRFIHLYATEPADAIAAETRERVNAINTRIQEEFPVFQETLGLLLRQIGDIGRSMGEASEKERTSLKKELRKIRYLGFAILGAAAAASLYFGLQLR